MASARVPACCPRGSGSATGEVWLGPCGPPGSAVPVAAPPVAPVNAGGAGEVGLAALTSLYLYAPFRHPACHRRCCRSEMWPTDAARRLRIHRAGEGSTFSGYAQEHRPG